MDFSAYHPQFFTATIRNWKHLLAADIYKDIVIESFRFMVAKKRVEINGFVIMPNHIHLIWQILSMHTMECVQRDLLKYTAQQMKFDILKNSPELLKEFEVNAKDRKHQFWKRNSLSIDLFTEKVFNQKLDYIHNNPCQPHWMLSSAPEQYKYSSAKYYDTGIDDFGFLKHFAG